jgi:hypothetical protein
LSLDELKYEYPDEPVPQGKSPQSHLEDLTWQGAAWRFPHGIPAHVRDTLDKEIALIAELDYARYFLTVHDIVNFARSRGILCQGRVADHHLGVGGAVGEIERERFKGDGYTAGAAHGEAERGGAHDLEAESAIVGDRIDGAAVSTGEPLGADEDHLHQTLGVLFRRKADTNGIQFFDLFKQAV